MSHGRYSTYDVRIRAVKAVLGGGFAIGDIADAYGTDRTTLFRWIKRHRDHGENGLHRRAGGVTGVPAAFSVKLGKVSEVS